MRLQVVPIGNILTRTTGYLKSVTSHSLQPYRGCSFGRSLCGIGCYVRHNHWITQGRPWGSFLEVRANASASYRERYAPEARWARSRRGGFSIFMSSATDPFLPQESKYGITRSLLEEMSLRPPDALVVQTHSHRVLDALPQLTALGKRCRVRVHLSIETDRDRLPGLPPPASSVDRRFEAARRLKTEGLQTVITVSPLLPIADPPAFFRRIADCADAVVLDHFIGGDGTTDGRRTRKTGLPRAIAEIDPRALDLSYRDRMADVAERFLPDRVGVGASGFAGRYSQTPRGKMSPNDSA